MRAQVVYPVLAVQEEIAQVLLQDSPHGRIPRTPRAATLAVLDPGQLRAFAHVHGLYGLPTLELIEWLAPLLAGKKLLEIGAGLGGFGRPFGATLTDSMVQLQGTVALVYALMQQPTIIYPRDVHRVDAARAAKQLRPDVILASWVTQRFDASAGDVEGASLAFAHGVDWPRVFRWCPKVVFLGSERNHGTQRWQTRPDLVEVAGPVLWGRGGVADARLWLMGFSDAELKLLGA